jgi:hypothetical protein
LAAGWEVEGWAVEMEAGMEEGVLAGGWEGGWEGWVRVEAAAGLEAG